MLAVPFEDEGHRSVCRERDCPGLPGMVEVTVTSALSNKYPTISLYEFNHITDLHQ